MVSFRTVRFFFLLLFSPSRRCSFRFSTGWVHDVLCDIRVVRQRQSPRRGPITHPHRTQISSRRAIVIIGTMHDPTTKTKSHEHDEMEQTNKQRRPRNYVQ